MTDFIHKVLVPRLGIFARFVPRSLMGRDRQEVMQGDDTATQEAPETQVVEAQEREDVKTN